MLLRNLLDNALRYTPEGGQVKVHVARVLDHAVVSVMDDGPGMSADERQSLTARFARGQGSQGEGVGLGLSIVQRVVDLHGGELAFVDGLPRDAGCGLGVIVRLPVPAAPE